MDAFPAFFPLKGRRVVIAGSGAQAEAKAALFAGSPAELVRLEGPAASDPKAYAGSALIFIAGDEVFAKAVLAAAKSAGAPVNVVDRPALSDFHTPAIVDRGSLIAAIGSAGAAPVASQAIRSDLEARLPPRAGLMAAALGERREAFKAAFPDLGHRRAAMRSLLVGAEAADEAGALALVDAAIALGPTGGGRLWLIAPPREPDLITLRAQRALNIADVIVGPASAEGLVATHARRDAERLSLDEVNAEQIADLVRAGRLVAAVGLRHETAATWAGLGVRPQAIPPAP